MFRDLSNFENKFRLLKPTIRYEILKYFLIRRDFFYKIISFRHSKAGDPFECIIECKSRGEILIVEMIAYTQNKLEEKLAKLKEFISINQKYKEAVLFCSPSSVDVVKQSLKCFKDYSIIPSDAFLYLGVEWDKLDEEVSAFVPEKKEIELDKQDKMLAYAKEFLLKQKDVIPLSYCFDLYAVIKELLQDEQGQNFLIVTSKIYRLERYLQAFSSNENFSFVIFPSDRERYINLPSYSFQNAPKGKALLKNFNRVIKEGKKCVFFVSTELLSHILKLQGDGLPKFDFVIFEEGVELNKRKFSKNYPIAKKNSLYITFFDLLKSNPYPYFNPIEPNKLIFHLAHKTSDKECLIYDMFSFLASSEKIIDNKGRSLEIKRKKCKIIVFNHIDTSSAKIQNAFEKEAVSKGYQPYVNQKKLLELDCESNGEIFYFDNIADVKKMGDSTIDLIYFMNGVSRDIVEFFLNFQGERETTFVIPIEQNKKSKTISKNNNFEDIKILFYYVKQIGFPYFEAKKCQDFIETNLAKPLLDKKALIADEFKTEMQEEDAKEIIRMLPSFCLDNHNFSIDGKIFSIKRIEQKLTEGVDFLELFASNNWLEPNECLHRNILSDRGSMCNEQRFAKTISHIASSLGIEKLFLSEIKIGCFFIDSTNNPFVLAELLGNFPDLNNLGKKLERVLRNTYVKVKSLKSLIECIYEIRRKKITPKFLGQYFLNDQVLNRHYDDCSFVFLDLLDCNIKEAIGRFELFRDRLGNKGIMCVLMDRHLVFSEHFKRTRIELSYECSSIWVTNLSSISTKSPRCETTLVCFTKDSDTIKSFFHFAEDSHFDGYVPANVKTREFFLGDDWLFNEQETTLPLISTRDEQGIFAISSFGVLSNRDNFVWNYSKEKLVEKMKTMIDTYNQDLSAFVYEDFLNSITNSERSQEISIRKNNKVSKNDLCKFLDEKTITMDESKISWSTELKRAFVGGIKAEDLDEENIRIGLTHPFVKRYIYFDKFWLDRVGQTYSMFPKKESKNLILIIDKKNNTSFVSKHLVGIHCIGDALMLPLYIYQADGTKEHAISQDIVDKFRSHYENEQITAKDIFCYVFALLQNSTYLYRQDFQDSMPILFIANFFELAGLGKELVDLYTNELDLDFSIDSKEQSWQLQKDEKILFDAQNRKIVFGEKTHQIENIPSEFFTTKAGHRTFASWCGEFIKKLREDVGINSSNISSVKDYCKEIIRISQEATSIINKIQSAEL